MDLLNRENLRKAIREGKFTSVDDIANEFKMILKEVIQESANEEMTEYLGYSKNEVNPSTNYRNGYNSKSIKTKYGEVELEMPRDREGTFAPKLVKKRETILNGTEELIISLYAKGLSVRDIQGHLDDLYGYELSEQTISNITDTIVEKAKEWQSRPLNAIYPIIFMDATVLKVRVDRVVKNTPAYIMIGVNLDGVKEIIGIWIGENESSKYWLSLLNEIKNRGVNDVLIFAIDGLRGFSEAINAVYPKADVQKCVVHQIRNSLKFVSWKDRKKVANDLKTIYTAQTEEIALQRLEDFKESWDKQYPNISLSWESNWSELSTFFKYPNALRKLIYTTNPIESLNSIIKKKTNSKGSFPTIDSAFKMLFLAITNIQTKWNGSKVRDWSEIYPQLCIFFKEIMIKYTY